MTSPPPSDPPADRFDPAELRELEELAVQLALGAGEVVRAGRERTLVVAEKSTVTDLVTEVDRASERWLVDRLAVLRPGDAVLGEEGTGHGGSQDGAPQDDGTGQPHTGGGARVRWVVDPIDGTVNFVLGLPHYAVSVAAEIDGTVVAGAVGNPVTGETFHARLGGGAVLLRAGRPPEPLSGPRSVSLERAVIGTGFAYDAAVRAAQGAVVAALLPRLADIRRLGSAALDLCHVAAGRLDGYFEAGLNEWDYAAGALVAAEAGCVVTRAAGRMPGRWFVCAAGEQVSDDLLQAVTELGGTEVY